MTSQQTRESPCILSGVCPDEHCQTKLYFPSYDTSIECTNCGQRHPREALKSVSEVTDPDVALHNMVRKLLMGNFAPKKTTDSVKVLGLSNYQCKLLSPLLTMYGMDKQGKAQPLQTLTQKENFDCGNLGGRAFLIQPEHIDIMGYGRDQTGSALYLHNTLEQIRIINGNQDVLIPIHADGDGHCLVHGISRALVGRELFWHALRTNLKRHFEQNLQRYQTMFCDFVDKDEWKHIIAESDPDYLPGPNEVMGLQNIHIFGLANVLRRPIILLDSLSGLQSFGDYSGVFLPVLHTPDVCRGKDGKLNKPLCVAWSSSGRNHFIALVGVKGRPLPRLPRWMLMKAWGTPQEAIDQYIEFDSDGMCTVGGDRALQEKYVQRLATAMESMFLSKHSVHPSLVSDVYHYIYKRTGVVGVHQDVIIQRTREAVQEHQLYRCLICLAVSQVPGPLGHTAAPGIQGLRAGGELYLIAEQLQGKLEEGRIYDFPTHGLQCTYEAATDELIPEHTFKQSVACPWCQGKQLRRVRADCQIAYINGDRTSSTSSSTFCNCGHKHFWDGVEYDNPPKVFKVPLVWKGQTIEEDVVWFQNEIERPELNSNAFAIAESLVNRHYPGEFGNEQLVQKVVEAILQNTASKESSFQPPSLTDMPSTSQSPSSIPAQPRGASPRHTAGSGEAMDTQPGGREKGDSPGRQSGARSKEGSPSRLVGQTPTKIILTGSSKSLHKEELTLSETEKSLRKRISENAVLQTKSSEKRSQIDQSNKRSIPTGSEVIHQGQTLVAVDTGSSSSSSRTIEPPRDLRIRLSSSEGKQATLVLDASTTYSQLQTLIESRLHIPAARQRIKHGFPPKELRAPPADEDQTALPLRNGDKLMVEILPDPNTAAPHQSGHVTAGIAGNRQKRAGSSEHGLDHGALLREFQKGFNKMRENEENNLEAQLTSHNLIASLHGQDLWTYSKHKPELFDRGGLFYNIVERDLGLEDGKHCMLPSIPEKRFRLSLPNDRLELCLEPLGHFPVSPDVDELEKFKDVALGQRALEMGQRAMEMGQRSSEMSEVDIPDESTPSSSGYVAFAGRGQSLWIVGGASGPEEKEGRTVGKEGSTVSPEMDADVTKLKERSDEEQNVGKSSLGAIGGEVSDGVVQYGESHIPGGAKHPHSEVEQAGSQHSQFVESEHSIVGGGVQRDVGDGGATPSGTGTGTLNVDSSTFHSRGVGSVEGDMPMEVDEGREVSPSSAVHAPLPMDMDLSGESPAYSLSQPTATASNTGLVPELRTFKTEPVIGQRRGNTSNDRSLSELSSLLSRDTPNDTANINATDLSHGAAYSDGNSSARDSGSTQAGNEPRHVIGSEEIKASDPANQKESYVSKRLGPGYTVLVKKEEGTS